MSMSLDTHLPIIKLDSLAGSHYHEPVSYHLLIKSDGPFRNKTKRQILVEDDRGRLATPKLLYNDCDPDNFSIRNIEETQPG